MKSTGYLVLTVLLQIAVNVHAQVRMESIGVADGLSQGFITSIIQDKQGFIWLGTYDGLNRYDGYQIRRFTTKPFDLWSLQSSFITDIYEDERQLLWIGTHQGLHVFDPLTERFFYLSLPEHNLPANHVLKIMIDRNGDVFVHIPTEKAPTGVFFLRIPPDFVTRLRQDKQPLEGILAVQVKAPPSLDSYCDMLACLGDTMLLVSDKKGNTFGYSPTRQEFQTLDPHTLPSCSTDNHNIIWGKYRGYIFRWKLPDGRDTVPPVSRWYPIVPMNDGDIGMWFYNHGPFFRKNTREPIDFDISGGKEQILADTAFQKEFTKLVDYNGLWNNIVFVDRGGIIWVATGGLGVRKIHPRQLLFSSYLSGKSISSLRELPDGRIWVRLYSDESFVLNPKTGQKESPPWKNEKWVYEAMADSKGNCWIVEGSYPPYPGNRLLKFEQRTGRLTRLPDVLPFINGISEKIFEDRDGNIWVASHQGVAIRYKEGKEKSRRFSYAEIATNDPLSLRSTAIAQDKNGIIWIGTSRGLLRIDDANTDSPRFSFFKHDPNNPQSLSIDWVTSICPDPVHPDILWLGTRGGGLNRLNTTNHTFSFISETANGLPDNVVYGILPDDDGNLWCSTNRGLCRYNPGQNRFVTFQESNGLLSTEFNTNAYLRTRDGKLWFGGVNGLNVFSPEEIRSGHLAPSVAITGIKVRGAVRLPDSEGALSLPFEENNVLFEYAAMDFTNTATNRFRHRLKGIDKDWVYDGTTHSANYAALPPGNYVFELQGSSADSPWSEQPVMFHLTIHPPWYRSWLAWLVYVLVAASVFWGGIRYREQMFRLKHAAALNQIESERLKAFEATKNQFFANLAHELRTPLTVILGLANRLKRGAKTAEMEAHTRNIIEQGDALLTLTSQILDLAKLESDHFVLHFSNGNISQFVQHHTELLQPLAESKGLRLTVENKMAVVWMDFDPAQIQKILNNLIVNAIRHSAPGGVIRVKTALDNGGACLKLSVEDEGEGISPEDLPRVFDRFFQGSQPSRKTGASGLGLTLTRDLVRLMGGEIEVNSTQGKGTRFTMLLPISNQALRLSKPATANIQTKKTKPLPISTDQRHLPLLLILEDNEAVSDFLKLCLQNHYRLEISEDGEAGLTKAIELIPDLILTDVAMPRKNGFEVTSILKNDVRTSHIPIVMLTAKVEQQDRLEGKRRGANAYLTKPFEEAELLFVLNNLLQLQQQWKQRYTMFSSAQPALLETGRASEDLRVEDEFMKKVYAIFESDYSDETFNLERLCRLLGMSSSQLDRKMKVLSNQTPMHLLRSFRLQKARTMLQAEPQLSIKNVCFRTGFKSPSHFSRAFSEEFGVPPSGI